MAQDESDKPAPQPGVGNGASAGCVANPWGDAIITWAWSKAWETIRGVWSDAPAGGANAAEGEPGADARAAGKAPPDLTKEPECVQMAYLGALFAMAHAGGAVDRRETAFVLDYLGQLGLSETVLGVAKDYAEVPPRLRDCLRAVAAADEKIRVMLFNQLSEVAHRGEKVSIAETNALDLAQELLRVTDAFRNLVDDIYRNVREEEQAEQRTSDESDAWSKARKVAVGAGLAGLSVALAIPLIVPLLIGGMSGGAILAILAAIGSLLGGGVVAGVGLLMFGGVVGGTAAAALTAFLAERYFTDPDAIRLIARVRDLNLLLQELLDACSAAERELHRDRESGGPRDSHLRRMTAQVVDINRELARQMESRFVDEKKRIILEHEVEKLTESLRLMRSGDPAGQHRSTGRAQPGAAP